MIDLRSGQSAELATPISGSLEINEPIWFPTRGVTVLGWSIYTTGRSIVAACEPSTSRDGGSEIVILTPRSPDHGFDSDRRLAVNGFVFDPAREQDLGFVADLELESPVPLPATHDEPEPEGHSRHMGLLRR